jgi:hypothetical protein
LLEFSDGQVGVEISDLRLDDSTLVRALTQADRAAIDSPFGWPEPFIDAISSWRRTGQFPEDPRERLRLRATDLYVKDRALTPFSVSADKIGACAMRCALILTRLEQAEGTPLDRVNGKVIECYPSAALYRFGFTREEIRGAKTDDQVRDRLLKAITSRSGWLQLDPDTTSELARVGDKFDAFLAALVGRAAAIGLTEQPPKELADRATVEGWIHLPLPGSLARLGLTP